MKAQSYEIAICRDHPSHGVDVPAGMWGARLEDSDFRNILVKAMEELLQEAIFIEFRPQLNNHQSYIFCKGSGISMVEGT